MKNVCHDTYTLPSLSVLIFTFFLLTFIFPSFFSNFSPSLLIFRYTSVIVRSIVAAFRSVLLLTEMVALIYKCQALCDTSSSSCCVLLTMLNPYWILFQSHVCACCYHLLPQIKHEILISLMALGKIFIPQL